MPRPLAIFALLLTACIWGLAFTAQKSAMAGMGPMTFASVRFLLGGCVVLPLALREYRRRGTPLTARQWRNIGALSLVFFTGSWLQQVGLTMTTVTNGGFLTALYVLFVPLIAFIFLRTKPHPIVWLCVPMALIGTWYLNGGKLDGFNFGDLLIVFCAVFWALQVLMLGRVATDTGLPIFVSCIGFVVSGVLAAPPALLFEHPTLAAIASGWFEIGYAGILATAVGFTLQAVGQLYVAPANAAVILSAESLFSALGGALFLGERLPPVGYIGAALIFAAIVLVESLPALVQHHRRPRLPAG